MAVPPDMTSRRTTRSLSLSALALIVATGLSACSGDDDRSGGKRAGDIDARSYYDDYESAEMDYATGAPAPSKAPSTVAEDEGGEPPKIPDPDQDNNFVDAGSSGFINTADDPLSTFALDVDNGSFNVARTLLQDGYPVPPASIRAEEWINAMAYDDEAPTDSDLGLSTDSWDAPTLPGAEVVRVGVSARDVDAEDRQRVNVTLVVDRSGSMDIRERLGLVQSSLALLAENLDPDDTVSVVSFEDQATPLLEPTKISDRAEIIDAIENLEPGGSTNLEAGLRLGYDQARENFDPESVNLVVLCSDGVANVGETGPGSLVDKIQEEGADGIHLVTVGFGMGNYNDHLMEQLADLGDGFYSYVDTFDEAEQLFGSDLVTTLTPVAGEARSQVSFDPEKVESYRLIGYDNREIADEDYDDVNVDAGELGAGHHATALYEVELAPGVERGESIGTASVKWVSVADGSTQETTIDLLSAEVYEGGDTDPLPSEELSVAMLSADLAQVLKQDPAFAKRGVQLTDLRERAEDLQERDIEAADELLEMIELAGKINAEAPQPPQE